MVVFYIGFVLWCAGWIIAAVAIDHAPNKQFHWGVVCGVHSIVILLMFGRLLQAL